jgi:hypothetical protein
MKIRPSSIAAAIALRVVGMGVRCFQRSVARDRMLHARAVSPVETDATDRMDFPASERRQPARAVTS